MKKALIFSVSCCLLLASCENTTDNATNEEDAKLFATIDVRKEFQQKSPLAEEINIELLEKPLANGENIKLTASFNDDDVKRIEEEFLALEFGKEKVVLRDDGKGADAKKGDGVFSVHLKEDIDELIKELDIAKEQKLSGRGPSFNARSIVEADQKGLKNFSPKDLKTRKKLRIPAFIFPFPKGGGSSSAISFPILADKSLMITDVGVVEDPTRTFRPCDMNAATAGNPNGVWTFGELMRQMASPSPGAIANDANTINFILDWLQTWSVLNTVNGDNVPPRGVNGIIADWQALSDQANSAAGNPIGPLLLERIPFKLTAIVNRLDLRGNSGYGFSDAGEGRLVYCLLTTNCDPLEFNVIFEYGINKKTCPSVKAFGLEWANLSDPALALGSPAFNGQLEAITNQFTLSGTNTSKPNQNSINQVRTNEFEIGTPWELREFNLTGSGKLEIVDVKMEPARKYNTKNANPQTQLLANYANANEPDILANNYEIPLTFSGADFRGGTSHTQFPPTGPVNVPGNTPHHWDGRTAAPFLINSDDARHILSLNTCSGCHGGETQTFFTHIDPAPFGTAAGLSGFLTGTPGRGGAVDADGLANNIMTVIDPAGRPAGAPTQRGFNDLERRVIDLDVLINQNCFSISALGIMHKLTFKPLVMTH
ncbi:MAG: hypothetical protein P8P74_01430 [Crocinitomicaceae bacterium]|nr:hypothetical protein [Crocinitomicaceae bacterium]